MPDFAVKTAFTAVDRVSPAFNKMSGAADRFGKKTTSMFSQLAGAAGMFGGVALLAMGLKKVATSAMMIEDAQASFTPLLGSVEKATKLVDMLNVAAAETPFQFEDLTKVAKQLLPVMDGDLNNTIRTMKMLGDTAGGNAQKLDSITRGYTKAMLKGKVDMESLNMIAEAGVPIHTELAKSMGYGKDRMGEFFKVVSSGKVGTDELNKAFVKMTSQGGIFFQGMIIASKTTSGVLSTMSDNLTMVAGAIGTELLPTFKDIAIAISEAAGSVLNFIRDNKDMIRMIVGILIPAIKWTIAAFVGWKIILKGIWFWQKAVIAVGYVQNLAKVADMMIISGSEGSKFILMLKQTALWQKAVAFATTAWSNAQKVINFLLYICPVMIVVGAVIALGYAIYDLYTNWEKYQLNFNVSIQNFITGFARAKMEVYELLNAIGLISDKELTGAKLNFLKNFTEGTKLQIQQIRANKAPNESNVAMQSQNNTTVNINSNGTEASADVTPRQNAKINMNLGYQN